MKKYNRVMLGQQSMYAKTCRAENYIGADFDIHEDLTDSLYENWREFNKKYIPIYMDNMPGKSVTSAGLSCGFLWTIAKGLNIGDVVLCPTGEGSYYVGTISSDYYYVPDTNLPHRRRVVWIDKTINRADMSEKLRNSSGSIGTCCDISKYQSEIETLISGGTYTPADIKTEAQAVVKVSDYDERKLHKPFASVLRSWNIYAKTIFHEKSSTKTDSAQKWVHPDMIGVEFEEFSDATLSLLKATEPKEFFHLYSYELKKRIDTDYQLKQYYFQALSNSSWANYGYLVAFEINETLMEEMARLNNAFGIGIIHMQAAESKILFPARKKQLDYVTIEKLNIINKDFSTFISKLSKVVNASKEYTSDAKMSFEQICDSIFLSDEDMENYCTNNNIPF